MLWLVYLLASEVPRMQRMSYTGAGETALSLGLTETVQLYRDWTVSAISVAPLNILAAVLAALLVRRITRWQEAHRERLDRPVRPIAAVNPAGR